MARGKYSAWLHVLAAFLYSSAIWGSPVTVALEGRHPDSALFAGVLVGALPSTFVFWNRWRTIEAYTSRSLSGIRIISILYAPMVALVYAYIRAFKKVVGA